MSNKYTELEKKGRDITIELLKSRIQLVELDLNSRVDFSGSTLTGNVFLETKYRNCTSSEYPSDMLELTKLEGMQLASTPKAHLFYICIFTDGVARLHYLNNKTLTATRFTSYWCPVSKAEPEKGNEKKWCIELPNHKAEKLTYDHKGLQQPS
jgi:hypothetical protein